MNIIKISEKLPAPNQYFFLVFSGKPEKEFVPAISRCYCDKKCFMDYLRIFGKDGLLTTTRPGVFLFGWAEMFPNTKTYKYKLINE